MLLTEQDYSRLKKRFYGLGNNTAGLLKNNRKNY